MDRVTAKVFMNGRSQAIRLPKEFRVQGDEVYFTKECVLLHSSGIGVILLS